MTAHVKSTLLVCCVLVLGAVGIEGHRPHDSVAAMAVSRDGRTVFATVRRFLLRSTDSGRTWRWSAFGLYLHQFNSDDSTRVFLSPTFARDATVYVHAVNGVSKSVDGGNVWVLQPNSPVSLHGYDNLVFSPWFAVNGSSLRGTFAIGGRLVSPNVTDVFLSRDGGATYERTNCPVAPLAMLWTAVGLLVSDAAGGVYVSQGHGNWSLLATANFTVTHAVETDAAAGQTRVLLGGPTDVMHLTLCRNPELRVCGRTSYTSAIRGTFFLEHACLCCRR
jgi:hypothetical protein